MKGIIGKKIGMTSVFSPDGKQTAVTIIEAGPCVVTQVKTKEIGRLHFPPVSVRRQERKAHYSQQKKITSPKSNTSPKQFVKEFRNFSIEKNLR